MPDQYSDFQHPDDGGLGGGAYGNAEGVQYDPRQGVANFAPGANTGRINDPRAFGGTSGAVIAGPDGKPMIDPSQSGRAQAVGRDRGIADAAANREAYKMNFNAGDKDRNASQVTHQNQQKSTRLLADAAHGNAPSGAVMRGQGATDDSFASQLGAQAGAKGGAANQAAANQAGAAGAAGHQLGVAGALGAARSGELTAARGAYSTGANTMRAGDYQQQAVDQSRAHEQLVNEMKQRDLNQKRQLAYEGLGNRTNDDAMRQGGHDAARAAGIVVHNANRDTTQQNRVADYFGQTVNQMSSSGGPGGGGGPPQQQPQQQDEGGGGDAGGG